MHVVDRYASMTTLYIFEYENNMRVFGYGAEMTVEDLLNLTETVQDFIIICSILYISIF